MTSFKIIGDTPRKSNYNPNLADELNKQVAEEKRLEELERRKTGKKKPEEKPVEEIIEEPSRNHIVMPSDDLSFITDENMHKEIIKYMTSKFPAHAEVLNNKFIWDKNQKVAIGSNPYIYTAIDMFLREQNVGLRIATLNDLETNLEMFKDKYYEDVGLALRSLKDPNKDKAKYLYEQLKKIDKKVKFPIYVQLRGLTLDENLNFNLTDEAVYKTAKCLNWSSGTKYSEKDELSLPKSKDESSSRQIWTREDGLSRCYLNRYLDFGSVNDDLAYSYGYGRVALAKPRSG
jgi:hypothetical protein